MHLADRKSFKPSGSGSNAARWDAVPSQVGRCRLAGALELPVCSCSTTRSAFGAWSVSSQFAT